MCPPLLLLPSTVNMVAFKRLLHAQILQQELQEAKRFVAISSRKKSASFIIYTAENTFSQQAILLLILQLDLRIKCGILHLLYKSSYKIWKTVNEIIHDSMWVMVGCFWFVFCFCTLYKFCTKFCFCTLVMLIFSKS